jgi:hypothetical protein
LTGDPRDVIVSEAASTRRSLLGRSCGLRGCTVAETVRLRISLGAGAELDLEGGEDLLDKYDEEIRALLAKLNSIPSEPAERDSGMELVQLADTPVATSSVSLEALDFGELLHRLPRTATAVDKILVAGWFAQREKGGEPFETRDANRLLLEQGVKLPNPSQSMTNNLRRKHLFKVGNAYRVSRDGQDHVAELLGR